MEFSDAVLQEYSISKSLITEDGKLNLYINGEFVEVEDYAGLRENLSGTGIRRAISENLVGNYDPTTESSQPTDAVTSNEDFFDRLEGIFADFGKASEPLDAPE